MCHFLLQRFNRPVEAGLLKKVFRTISEGPERYLIMLRFKGVSRKLDKLKGGGVAASKVLSLKIVGNGIFRVFSTSSVRSFH
jgi:hypothetical protein